MTAPTTVTNIAQILNTASVCAVIGWIFWLLLMMSIIFTLVAAFRYLTAAGDPEKVKRAGATLLYVVIAVVVALLAKGFPFIISNFFGVQLAGLAC